MTDAATIGYAVLCLFAGGLVKGTIGIGLPLVAVPLLSFAMPLREAVPLLSMSIVLTNLTQSFEGRRIVPTLRRFWLLIAVLLATIVAATQLLVLVSEKALFLIIGVGMIAITVALRFQPQFRLSGRLETWLSPPAGVLAGFMGGLGGFFGPVLMLFLAALRLPKDVFVPTISLLYFCAGTTLALSLAGLGVADSGDFLLSLVATLPTFAGQWLGRQARMRMSEGRFANALYVAYLGVGANFLIRAVL